MGPRWLRRPPAPESGCAGDPESDSDRGDALVSEIVIVDDEVEEVSCNGGKTFGHPRIYMTLGEDGAAECYYCGRRFARKSAAGSETAQDDAA